MVGVDRVKAALSALLSLGQTVRFSERREDRFFEELARNTESSAMRGAPVRLWKLVPGRRAETLGCMAFTQAERNLVGLNLDRRESEVTNEKAKTRQPAVVRSAWIGLYCQHATAQAADRI